MLDYRTSPQPETCDVCRYVVDHNLDCAYEHARVRVAAAFLIEDLQELEPGESARLGSLVVSATGVEPGPVHPLDPRHWFWAIFYEPDIRISLQRRRG